MEENRPVEDVLSACLGLRSQGEWLSAWPVVGLPDSGAPFEASSKHYQGIQRSPRGPWFYVTRSGRVNDPADLGFLAVIRIATRTTSGAERLRSNLLVKNSESSDTDPPDGDQVFDFITYDDYQHPGGMQMVGDILAVPLETPKEGLAIPRSVVRFYDCSTPWNPTRIEYQLGLDGNLLDGAAGVVAMIKLPEPDGRFLLLVTGGHNEIVEFYCSNRSSFSEEGFAFEHHDTWHAPRDIFSQLFFWPGLLGTQAWQSLSFVNQTDGKLFLVASANNLLTAPFVNGNDVTAVYEVTGFGPDQEISIRREVFLGLHDLRANDELLQDEYFGNFNGGGGTYVTPTGELLYYSMFHYDFPFGAASGTIRLRLAELRHELVSRHGTCGPQFGTNHLGGPYTIDEGSSLFLDGTVHVVQPWVDMFQDGDFRGQAQMLDFDDQSMEDYQNFKELDGRRSKFTKPGTNGFGDKMTSFRWCGSSEYILEIYEHDGFRGDVYSGGLTGTGSVFSVPHVGGFNDKASSARIRLVSPPQAPGYAWDLDGDGQFLEYLDLPFAVFVSLGGSSVTTVSMSYDDHVVSTTVTVRNVPPTIDAAVFENSVVQEGAEARLRVDWSDAGATLHTLTIDWGDGTSTPRTFAVSRSGRADTSHVYADNGRYPVSLRLWDGEALAETTLNLDVRNAPPTVAAGPDVRILEGGLVELAPSTFNDPGTLDTHTATIDWGDTTTGPGLVAESPFGPPGSTAGANGTVSGMRLYGDNGLYTVTLAVTDHDGGIGTDAFTVAVANLPPTLELDTSAATQFPAGPAFTGRVGVVQHYAASSLDAGSDDLTFLWRAVDETRLLTLDVSNFTHLNDGASPDLLPSSIGTYPFEVLDQPTFVFPAPGVYTVRIRLDDDDGGVDEQSLSQLVVGDDRCARNMGLWRHQFSERGNHQVDDVTLGAHLGFIAFASSYFPERIPANTITEARELLAPRNPGSGGSGNSNAEMGMKTAQELFAAWLNLASGSVGMFERLGNGSTALETLYLIEAVLFDPTSEHHDFLAAQETLRLINNVGCR